jgi:hypothetical protein
MAFLDISLGSLAMLMLYELVHGSWIAPIRSYLNAALAPLPLLSILFIPALVAAFHLFPWSEWTHLKGVAAFKTAYLASWPFVVRSLVALGAWCALAWYLRKGRVRGEGASAVGLIVYAVTLTWAANDWIASLQPVWSSSILGLVVLAAQGIAAFAFVTLCVTRKPSAGDRPTSDECGDLANLMLTFVMTWAYLAFVQFLIVWAEDLPRETIWYLPRVQQSWRYWSLAVFIGQFALPFGLLLFRRIKRNPAGLCAIASLLLVAHALYTFWLVVPSLEPDGWSLSWMDFLALIVVGGSWLCIFSLDLAASPKNGERAAEEPPHPGVLHAR